MAGLESDCTDECFEPFGVGRSRIERETHSGGNDVPRTRLDIELSNRRNGAGDSQGGVTDLEYSLGRCHERVLASLHRRRSGVPRAPLEHELRARVANDPGDDPERRVRSSEDGALLDVELEECSWERPAAGDECSAADAADLLAPERDHGAGAGAFDRLDRGDDAECAVESTPSGNAVEVRACPHGTCRGV